MKYTRASKGTASLVKCRFDAKKLRDFAMTTSAIQGSGTNSIEKQTAGIGSNASANVIKTEGNLDSFRDMQRETRIDKTLLLKQRIKDKKKSLRPPVLPIALKQSIKSEETKNSISPLI